MRQLVGSTVGTSSGNGSFETRGSETVSEVSMGRLRLQNLLTFFSCLPFSKPFLTFKKTFFYLTFENLFVIDPCIFLISSHVNTDCTHHVVVRRRLASQAIEKQVIVPIHS